MKANISEKKLGSAAVLALFDEDEHDLESYTMCTTSQGKIKNQNNIVEISQAIQDSIKEYQLLNPDCKSTIINSMVKFEGSVYSPDTELRI